MLQATLNATMIDEGISRYRSGVESARKREEESKTKYGQRLLSSAIIPFSTAIADWLKENEAKRAGHRAAAYGPLKSLSPDVVAFVAARGALDCIGLTKSYASTLDIIGSLLEDEVRFLWLKRNHAGLFRKLENQLERTSCYAQKRTVIVHAMNKGGISPKRGQDAGEGMFEPWDKPMRVKVGMVVVDLFQKATGLVQVTTMGNGKRRQHIIHATPKTTEWIRGFNAYAEILDPVWLPMVEKPLAWTGPNAGGYSGAGLPTLPLVKRTSKAYLEEILPKADMPDVYEMVNALQETPWKINRRVHSTLQHLWDIGRSVGGLPPSDDEELPRKPDDIATNKDALKAWKMRAHRVHSSNAALRSVRLQARKLLNLAQKFVNVPEFYFPHQLDFRGRVYAVPTFLSPQGSDLSRSLLLFAEGVPLNDDTDAYWLAVYGANLFGKDKITFEDRIAWVGTQRENILAVASDPMACQWWQTADEPWQFLAWCFEWAGWLKQGPGYVSHFPVNLDGTNNGLQILSMLMRDEVAAKATNVLPNESPADIYGDVAKRVVELMQREPGGATADHAQYWLRFGINRKTTKRPVMVLPYGGTFHSCRDYVRQWYEETAKAKNEELPDFKTLSQRTHYLAMRIWEGIEFCVGRPRQAMTWLQSCASVFAEHQLPILWHSPSGFPVLQAYKDYKELRVETVLGDHVRVMKLRVEHATKLSKSRQKNGISPNYVHSCDAAALVKTVVLSRKLGVRNFAMIHDSYGTHSPKVHEMASALRQAFVTIFTDDRLSMLRAELQAQLSAAGVSEELPPVPAFGTLNLQELYSSEFFFA